MEKSITAPETRAYEKRLRELRATLVDRIEAVESASLEAPGATRSTKEDEALEETSTDEGVSLLSNQIELRQEVDDALDRIADGTYGVCQTCGAVIARERLDVLPYASQCARCAKREAANRER
jgi:RNA polymerase-binding transcription factor DksA